jgi:hypothetical protein
MFSLRQNQDKNEQEVEYQLLINNLIDKYIYDKVNNNVDCLLLWDVLKIEIREIEIEISLLTKSGTQEGIYK